MNVMKEYVMRILHILML